MGKNAWIFVTDRETWVDCAEDGSYGLKRALIRNAESGDPLVAYIQRESVFAGLGQLTSFYYHDEEDKEFPHRVRIELTLDFDNAVDVRSIVNELSCFPDKAHWPVRLKGGAIKIPVSDYEIIKAAIERKKLGKEIESKLSVEKGIEKKGLHETITSLPELAASSLHDRIAEMLHIIGLLMGYNSVQRYRTRSDSPYQIDVAWLQSKNPQIAIEVHHGGNLGDALDRLRHARDFNFRKVIMIIVEPEDYRRAKNILKFDDKLKHVIDLWSVKSIYDMYSSCVEFYRLYGRFGESVYKEELEAELL